MLIFSPYKISRAPSEPNIIIGGLWTTPVRSPLRPVRGGQAAHVGELSFRLKNDLFFIKC